MRLRMIAVAALCVAAAAEGASAQAPATMPKLDKGDWYELDTSKDGETVMFVRSAKASGTAPRLWVRYEFRTASKVGTESYRSSAALQEYDCAEERIRAIQSTYYTRNNLLGESYSPHLSQQWSYSRPGTIGYATLELACMKDEGN